MHRLPLPAELRGDVRGEEDGIDGGGAAGVEWDRGL